MKHLLAALLMIAPASSAIPATASAPIATQILSAHNTERAAAGAMPLAWDDRLASGAKIYAVQLALMDRFEHSPLTERSGQGENLWRGTAGAFRVEAMAADWAAEKKFFRAGVFPQVSRNGSWQDVGHYTQMIWPATRRVGCAVASSGKWDYLVCRYAEPGNVLGDRVGSDQLAHK